MPDFLALPIHQRHVRIYVSPTSRFDVNEQKRILLGKQPGVPLPPPGHISSKHTPCRASDGYGRYRPHQASHTYTHIHSHTAHGSSLSHPHRSFPWAYHRADATPPSALFTSFQTTLSSHATLTYDFSRYNEPSGTVNRLPSCLAPLLTFEHTPHRAIFISSEPHLSHFALHFSAVRTHSSRATSTFDVDRDIVNPRSTHFVSGSASGIRAHSTDPLPPTHTAAVRR